jgi:hypothetical protein
MKFLLDFDHTLLDTTAFVEQVRADGRDSILITPGIWSHYDVRDFLYPDVLNWLESKAKEDLCILTAMTPQLGPEAGAFQKEKLHSGRFDDLVESVVFMIGEKGEAGDKIAYNFSPQETTVFVDDKIEQCLSVKNAVPHAHVFLMVREPEQIGSVQQIQNIHVVHTLADVDAIIEVI